MSGNGQAGTAGEAARRAAEAIAAGEEVRRRVRALVLEALSRQRLDREGLRATVREVAEGLLRGAQGAGAGSAGTLAEALRGIDEALGRSAEAVRAVLERWIAAGRDYSDHELRAALSAFAKLEEDFLAALGAAAEGAGGRAAEELRRWVDQARSGGTDTGRRVAAALAQLGARLSVASVELALAGAQVAAEFGARFAELAGAVLGGMADALARKEDAKGG